MEPDNRDFLELLRDTEAAVQALLALLGTRLARAILQNGRRRPERVQGIVTDAIADFFDEYREAITRGGGRGWRTAGR